MKTSTGRNEANKGAEEETKWRMLSSRVSPRLYFQVHLAALLGDESCQSLIARALENEVAATFGSDDVSGDRHTAQAGA